MQIDTLKRAASAGDVQACLELARGYAARDDFVQARAWLERAHALGDIQAGHELGMLAAYAPDRASPDVAAARIHFDHAARAGHAEARYRLALIALGGEPTTLDADAILGAVHAAALGGCVPALRALGMAWAHAGDSDAARACFAHGFALHDAVAAFLLARLTRDPEQAQRLDAYAAAHGVRRAAAFVREANLATPGDPGSLPGVPPAHVLATPLAGAHEHHAQPRIATFDGVFSALECEYVIALAAAHVQPSMVHDPQTGGPMRHPIRTSSSMTFPRHDEDLWLRELQRRLAALAATPLALAEPLAVLRYAPGEEYRPHRDYLRDPAELAAPAPGQRVRTIFAYLTDVPEGGATDFPILGVRIAPQRGRVVLFDNLRADGVADPDTLHAGLPVVRGRKWLATLWLRERPLRAW